MKKKGFTLMELLIAMSIVAILTVIGVVSYRSLTARSRDAKRKSDMEQVRSALEMYRVEIGSYPEISTDFIAFSGEDLGLVPTYLPATPMDPRSTAAVPLPYFYKPLLPSGGKYYGYCLCGMLDAESVSNECSGLGVTLPSLSCNYGRKNP